VNLPSIYSAIRAIGDGDMLFSLSNSRFQRSLPFLELTILSAVFVAVTPLFFPSEGTNGLALGVMTSFLVFWGAVVVGFLVVVLFGLNAPVAVVQKASFIAIATFTVAILLFDFNLLFGTENIEYLGDDWEPRWLVSLAYTLPYPLYCLVQGELRLRRRIRRAVSRLGKARWTLRLSRARVGLTAKALASAAVIIAFSAVMMHAGVIGERRTGFKEAVNTVTAALTFQPQQ
jgi:hypothetical protein